MENKMPVEFDEEVVPCLEVCLSRRVIESSGSNLLWTLSVYSLDNQPLGNGVVHSDVISYHFMIYDWRKTIKQLLDDIGVPYTVLQYFTVDTLYRSPRRRVTIARREAQVRFETNIAVAEQHQVEPHFA
jgi:hypothetical protein